MSSEESLAVRTRHLSKKFPLYEHPYQRWLEVLTLRRKNFHENFWALRDVDLEVPAGMTVGIIGPNGSGKSTLLQIIAGILRQTQGDCLVDGQVSALLELGAGFSPEFTGRDNVFMSGAILGFSHQEMAKRMEAILDFAEIGEFIDRPVKTYSTGLFTRLAFAVAIHVDPDILLVDESLAVGDIVFQHRCVNRFRRFKEEGKTLLLVTHDLGAVVQFCDRAILLREGRKLADDEPGRVVQVYRSLVAAQEKGFEEDGATATTGAAVSGLPRLERIPNVDHRYGEGAALVRGIAVHNAQGTPVEVANAGEKLGVLVTVQSKEELRRPIVGFTVRDRHGVDIFGANTSSQKVQLPDLSAGQWITVAFRFEVPPLRPGSYSLAPAVSTGSIWENTIQDWVDNACHLEVLKTGLVYGMMTWPVEPNYQIFQ